MAPSSALKFYFMHFMPYPDLPGDYGNRDKYPSSWVDLPNRLYDPAKGQALYRRYLDEMVLADKLGYDGLIINEHHNTAYSMMAACSLIGAALIERTQRAKICLWGVPINLEYPNRLAEEYAILDVMSGGRVEVAFPLGTGMEYWANATNPATARERMREALEIILQSWQADGPTAYYGKYYTYRYLNPWPRPLQKPRPRCYLVGSGSPEIVDLAAELGFGYSVVFVPISQQLRTFERYRERSAECGHETGPDDTPIGVMAYVAESDEQARREFEPHVRSFFETFLRTRAHYLSPPGYLSIEEFRRRAGSAVDLAKLHGGGSFDWDAFTGHSRVIAGTPERVAEAIAGWARQAGSSTITCHLHLGDMPHWKVVKNLTLFAEEVMPRLRDVRIGGAARAAAAPLHSATALQVAK
jgi:alkanesulfonate monooxygenase SsuD/methylene tetrahydromethanopterin reductase-like flavin-dependent oxidoreductase (luciferase family)